MTQDEIFYEYRELDSVMEIAKNKLLQILCTLYTGLNQNVGSFVQRSEIIDIYRDSMAGTSRTNRSKRDYAIARDTSRLLQSMSRKYDNISSSFDV